MDWDKIESAGGGLSVEEYHIEALLALGAEYIYNGLVLPAPTAGNVVLLETLNSPFIKGGEVKDEDIDTAVYVISLGKDVVSAVFEEKIFDSPMTERVRDFIESIPGYDRSVIRVFLNTYFKYSMHGFDMLPSGEGETPKMCFDTEWLATYISVCTSVTGYNADRVVWNMPLTFGGFCIARNCKENGVKGIERPRDWKSLFNEIKRQMEDGE